MHLRQYMCKYIAAQTVFYSTKRMKKHHHDNDNYKQTRLLSRPSFYSFDIFKNRPCYVVNYLNANLVSLKFPKLFAKNTKTLTFNPKRLKSIYDA